MICSNCGQECHCSIFTYKIRTGEVLDRYCSMSCLISSQVSQL